MATATRAAEIRPSDFLNLDALLFAPRGRAVTCEGTAGIQAFR